MCSSALADGRWQQVYYPRLSHTPRYFPNHLCPFCYFSPLLAGEWPRTEEEEEEEIRFWGMFGRLHVRRAFLPVELAQEPVQKGHK